MYAEADMTPKESEFNQPEKASAWCARLAWRFPCSPAIESDGEVIHRQHFCHHNLLSNVRLRNNQTVRNVYMWMQQ